MISLGVYFLCVAYVFRAFKTMWWNRHFVRFFANYRTGNTYKYFIFPFRSMQRISAICDQWQLVDKADELDRAWWANYCQLRVCRQSDAIYRVVQKRHIV